MRGFLIAGLLLISQTGSGEDAASHKPNGVNHATYSITGLHCPPCTRTVESSLQKVKGVKKVKVDWGSKSAKVEFDERVVSAQQIASAVATTPHMMGAGMRYGSWLALSVPEIKDEASAKKAEATAGALKGVAKASASAKQHTISVQFSADGRVTTQELINLLGQAGFKATTY